MLECPLLLPRGLPASIFVFGGLRVPIEKMRKPFSIYFPDPSGSLSSPLAWMIPSGQIMDTILWFIIAISMTRSGICGTIWTPYLPWSSSEESFILKRWGVQEDQTRGYSFPLSLAARRNEARRYLSRTAPDKMLLIL